MNPLILFAIAGGLFAWWRSNRTMATQAQVQTARALGDAVGEAVGTAVVEQTTDLARQIDRTRTIEDNLSLLTNVANQELANLEGVERSQTMINNLVADRLAKLEQAHFAYVVEVGDRDFNNMATKRRIIIAPNSSLTHEMHDYYRL